MLGGVGLGLNVFVGCLFGLGGVSLIGGVSVFLFSIGVAGGVIFLLFLVGFLVFLIGGFLICVVGGG